MKKTSNITFYGYALLYYATLLDYAPCANVLTSPSQSFGSTMFSLAKIYCFVFTISDHLAGKMASSRGDLIARLKDDRDLTRKTRQTSKEDDRQALPAETDSAFAEITNGFVLTDACTMHQAKTMASKLASYKFEHIPWRHVLNNATSMRGKKCGGPTCGPIRDLLTSHLVYDLKIDVTSLLDPSTLHLNPKNVSKTEEVSKALNECQVEWCCAILNMPNSFKMGDQLALKVAAAAESEERMQISGK